MLEKRVLTAVIGIPILLVALYLGGLAWRLLITVLILAGLFEFRKMGDTNLYPDYLFVSGLSFLIVTYSGIDGTKLLLWLVLQLMYYLVRATFAGMRNFAAAPNLLGVLYVSLLFSFLVLVREQFGMLWTLFGF